MAKDLKEIEKLIKEGRYDEALLECEENLEENSVEKVDILRAHARVLARCNNYERAIQDCEIIFEAGEGTLRDYYRAADYALSAGQFAQAAIWFKEVLQLGEEQNEAWFKAASYFLLAYAQMELGQHHEAITSLDGAVAVEPDVAMPIPSMCGMCSHQLLREKIKRQSKADAD